MAVAGDDDQEMRLFHETKQGIKGLVDSGITKIPQFMLISPDDAAALIAGNHSSAAAAVIDMRDLERRRKEVVEGIRNTAEEVGIFQVVGHGVEGRVMEELLTKAREFHALPGCMKEGYYSTDGLGRKVSVLSAPRNRRRESCSWVDILNCQVAPPLAPT